jgi:hypothetical protein
MKLSKKIREVLHKKKINVKIEIKVSLSQFDLKDYRLAHA